MKVLLFTLFIVLNITSLRAANIENGDDLHFENCTGCHDTTVYTRDNQA